MPPESNCALVPDADKQPANNNRANSLKKSFFMLPPHIEIEREDRGSNARPKQQFVNATEEPANCHFCQCPCSVPLADALLRLEENFGGDAWTALLQRGLDALWSCKWLLENPGSACEEYC